MSKLAVERFITGETVNGIPVLGWMWEKTVDGGPVRTTAYHWSTPPKNVKVTRLIDAEAIAALSRATEAVAPHAAWLGEGDGEKEQWWNAFNENAANAAHAIARAADAEERAEAAEEANKRLGEALDKLVFVYESSFDDAIPHRPDWLVQALASETAGGEPK